MKRWRIIVACACVLSVAVFTSSPASAGEAKAVAQRAQELAKMISPFVDEQTIVVMHADYSKVDPNAIFDMIQQDVLKMDGAAKLRVADEKKRMIGIHTALLKAGVKDVFAIVSFADLPNAPCFIVIPLMKGMDVRTVRSLAYSGKADGPVGAASEQDIRGRGNGHDFTEVINGCVVKASVGILKRLKAMKPAPRPHMEKAFAALEGTAGQVLLLPTDDNRRVIEEMMPELPPVVGGGASTAITRGVIWAAVGAVSPPKGSVKLVVQSAGAEEAKSLKKTLDRIVDAISDIPPVKRVFGDPKQVFTKLMPKVVGDQLRLSLSQKRILNVLSPAIVKANMLTKRDASKVHIHGICVGIMRYAADHENAMPKNLNELVKGQYASALMFVNQRFPGRKGHGYVYVKQAGKLSDIKEPTQTIMVYEKLDKWDPDGIVVGFADGHVGIVKDEKRFKAMLAASTPASTQPSKKKADIKK